MTVVSDLQKAIATAESLKGSYAMCAQGTEDQSTKKMFEDLEDDMSRHVSTLNSRLKFLENNSPLNQQQKNK